MFYLYAARAVSATDLRILPAYLSQLGVSPFQIGIVATAALLDSALLTLAIRLLDER